MLPPSDGSDSGATPHQGLENNPGKDGHIYNDTHPYFPKSCNECAAYRASGLKNRLKLLFRNQKKDCYNCPFIDGCLYGAEKEDVKQIKKKARKTVQGSVLTHPKFNGEIQVSRNSIDEWTNQPHMHYAEKNRMILHISEILKKSTYAGYKKDKSTKAGSHWIHLFEISIQNDNSWLIVKEYLDGNKILYSISDSPNILIGLIKK